ncbi:ShlB/FhaC/HecB family hemolysin secretion/activation protein [Pseudomonas sp. NPDC089752]|uniref:ShlB/FhaC/HecB family hemolysin secretion/activation protein n=1 Tax=Pseudomonas sp. NPDC089752 TaxID=3364472 RepID=UPI0038280C3B
MRPLVVPLLLLLAWASMALGEPLPGDTRLVLHKVRFEGGTVYPLSELREHYQPLIGHTISVNELQQFTERLTQRYQRDGYPLSYAYLPPQDLADGRVEVVLVEGYVQGYELLGDIGPAARFIEQVMERLQAERPMTRESLERAIGLLQRLPGLTVQAELTAAQGRDEANRLRLHVQRKPFDAALALNEGSRDDPEALFTLSSNAQTRYVEQLTASFLLPLGDAHTQFQRLDYSQYLDAQGSQLLLSAARFRSESGTRIRLEDGTDSTERRRGERFSLGLGQALRVAPDEWINLSGRVYSITEHIQYRSGALRDNDSYVRALSFEGDWRQAAARRQRIVSAGVYQGLDYLGARSDADYDMDFLRFRVSGVQSDQLFGNWQGVASGALYWSDDRLPDSERAVFGGQQFGRGYPRDQAAGDKGWGVAYELNYSIQRGGWLKRVQPYAVLDAAEAWYNGGPFEDAHLSSVALGVRLGYVALEVAKPLADVALDSLNRGPRVMFSFSYQLE